MQTAYAARKEQGIYLKILDQRIQFKAELDDR